MLHNQEYDSAAVTDTVRECWLIILFHPLSFWCFFSRLKLFCFSFTGGSMLYLFLCHSSTEPRWYDSWPKSVRTAQFSMPCQCSASSHTRKKMVKKTPYMLIKCICFSTFKVTYQARSLQLSKVTYLVRVMSGRVPLLKFCKYDFFLLNTNTKHS